MSRFNSCLAAIIVLFLAGTINGQTPSATVAPPAQQPSPAEAVRAIAPPRNPLPSEADSAGVSRFSFIVYGDTRGRRDGKEIQYEHSLVVESMLGTIKKLENTAYPVRFVLQTGDAVVDGRDPRQWNVSFVDLINRITTEGGVPYFLCPGNHDVTNAPTANEPKRQDGLRNYLGVLAQLIPPEGAPRRLDGYPTYAFGYGNTFVLAIDSNIADDDIQFDWVNAQLENLDRTRFKNVVAMFHHPVFSSGPHGGPKIEPPTEALRARYMPVLRKHQVKLLLTGHDHLFEHWIERYEDSQGVKRRIDQLITGGGGAPLYNYVGEPDLERYLFVNRPDKVRVQHLVRAGPEPNDNPYHYVAVRVDGEDLRVEVVGVGWGRDFQPYRSRGADLNNDQATEWLPRDLAPWEMQPRR